jgi:hypothetical protein
MIAVHPSASVVASPLSTATTRAQVLGLPATLFGFTPDNSAYWLEPGLPWLTPTMYDNMPLGYDGHPVLLCIGEMGGDNMAPRFPKGCSVQTAPVFEKGNLVVGRVYTYRYWDAQDEAWAVEIGRLTKIGGNYLEAQADNCPTPSIWLLRETEREAVWDVREVTHYVNYPSEEEEAAGAGSKGHFLPWLPLAAQAATA